MMYFQDPPIPCDSLGGKNTIFCCSFKTPKKNGGCDCRDARILNLSKFREIQDSWPAAFWDSSAIS